MVSNKNEEENSYIDNAIVTGGGSFIGGERIESNINVSGRDVYITMAGTVTPQDIENLRLSYLTFVRSSYEFLDLVGIPSLGRFTNKVSIDHVFVPLSLRESFDQDENISGTELKNKMVRIEDLINSGARLVILGDPGSGKTTLLKQLTLKLLSDEGGLLPILIPLNAYSEELTRSDKNLQQFLADYYAGLSRNLSKLEHLFNSALSKGEAVVLLDGLDEIPRKDRSFIASKLEAFAGEAISQGNTVVVTSRIIGYQEWPLDPNYWAHYTIQDLDFATIKEFLEKWFKATSTSKAGEGNNFVNAIESSPDLARLAHTPFFLTLIAITLNNTRQIPAQRVNLYELYVRMMLETWNQARSLNNKDMGQGLDYRETVTILGKLALWFMEEKPGIHALPEEIVLEWLTDYYAGIEWQKPLGEARKAAGVFLEGVQSRSGILRISREGYISFAHIALLEYFTARGIVSSKNNSGLEIIAKHAKESTWREVILLTIGIWGVIRQQKDIASSAIRELARLGDEGALLAKQSIAELGHDVFSETTISEFGNIVG